MNLAAISLRNRFTTLMLTAVLFVGGLLTYQDLSRLEDPEFTIKKALVITSYSGASPAEVEREVTEKIERAVQQMGQTKEVESRSERGLSIVTVTVKDQYGPDELPQVWDELRRKVNDMQGELPPMAGPSAVEDDYGDVYGIFVALYGSGYTAAELKRVAQDLRREYLLVKDVAKVELWGDRTEAIYIELDRDRAMQLGITPASLEASIVDKNLVVDAGRVQVGANLIAIDPTGTFTSSEAIGDLLVKGEQSDAQIYLRDIATIQRGYVEPRSRILRFDGQEAIGIGISTAAGGNVVEMGAAIDTRTQEILEQIPLGLEFGVISMQPDAVTSAISGFVVSLVEAVLIVVAVLLVFMGVRSGLIIGFILTLTIAGTFIFMDPWGVALERISLGALIIALGMLVDNAIVVVDGMLVRMQRGMSAEDSAIEVVGQTAIPLLGATAVAIMAFGAIGLSDDSTGEFCRSLFQVVLISLSLSWVTAMTVTPLVCVVCLKQPDPNAPQKEAYGGLLYGAYRLLLEGAIRFRWLTVVAVVGLFAASLYGFRYVDQSFFPESTRPQIMLDVWLPQGTGIEQTNAVVAQIEDYLEQQPQVSTVSAVVGAGALRFLLTYNQEDQNSAYAQLIVDIEDYRAGPALIDRIEGELGPRLPEAQIYGKRFILGPGSGGKVQARFSGADANVLRELEAQAMQIMRDDGRLKAIRSDWRNRVPYVQPVLAPIESNRAGIERPDVASTVRAGFEGEVIAQFREDDELLPIVIRARAEERNNVDNLNNLLIWSPAAGESLPLRQVVSSFDTRLRDPIIERLNRTPTLTVHADPMSGQVTTRILERVKPQIDALPLPPGYSLEWWGEFRDTGQGQAGILASLPFFLLAMVLIVVALFNSARQPLVIWCMVPLALVGVSAGLLLTGQPFGFMSLLGFLSLSGMLIKNAIVLVDEIELKKGEGEGPYDAIVKASVSRLRPVAMAALTTVLGMIPLLGDAFFVSMAVTIIFGLSFATVLTMVVVPVLYAIFFAVPSPERKSEAPLDSATGASLATS
ncbi:MAG: efflux RND transporter permease subunit [Pseudomonadota bacterium]